MGIGGILLWLATTRSTAHAEGSRSRTSELARDSEALAPLSQGLTRLSNEGERVTISSAPEPKGSENIEPLPSDTASIVHGNSNGP